MSALLDWWEQRFGGASMSHGVWFRPDGTVPRTIIWGPPRSHAAGWWIWPFGPVDQHLVSFTALTFPA